MPEAALTAQKIAAHDPLSESFASLMLSFASGNEIDMKGTVNIITTPLILVNDYAKNVNG